MLPELPEVRFSLSFKFRTLKKKSLKKIAQEFHSNAKELLMVPVPVEESTVPQVTVARQQCLADS